MDVNPINIDDVKRKKIKLILVALWLFIITRMMCLYIKYYHGKLQLSMYIF